MLKRTLHFIAGIVLLASALCNGVNAMDKLTLAEAEVIAQDYVSHMFPGQNVVLNPGSGKEYAFGWAFTATTAEFLQTHNANTLLFGIGPIVVENTGAVRSLPSAGSTETLVGYFLEKWLRVHDDYERSLKSKAR